MIGLLLLLPWLAAAGAAGKVAVRAGRIVPVVGPEIRDGVILIEDGRIAAVGRAKPEGKEPAEGKPGEPPFVDVPWDATVIDAAEQTVFPGMVEAHSSRGLDRPNENVPVTPFVTVLDAIDPVSFYFEDALRDGITTILVLPGNNCVIGGQGRVLKPYGRTVEAMTVKPEGGMKISVSPKSGFTRLSQMAELRKAFAELREYRERLVERKRDEREEEKAKERKEGTPKAPAAAGGDLVQEDDVDARKRPLVDLVEGRMPAFVWCERAMDVAHAIEVARGNGFLARTTLVLGPECWKAADEIKASARPVVLDATLLHVEEDPLTGEEKRTNVPRVFHEKGIPFALQTETSALGSRYLWYQAAACVRNGIPREAALRAITLTPAEILGLGSRLGSIEPGKDANLLLLTGDPLDAQTWVDRVLLEGELVYERAKDERLRRLLEGTEKPKEGKEK
ncbi:MAG TPA: amidohydrolase family protein [Planctomycetota bacterium]|jgi:imidazolonepropionase-like amidohydrolase|nr:amidohydrolase family protein [Planctomycetota bacterium]